MTASQAATSRRLNQIHQDRLVIDHVNRRIGHFSVDDICRSILRSGADLPDVQEILDRMVKAGTIRRLLGNATLYDRIVRKPSEGAA